MNQEMDRTKYNKLKERKETINKNSDLINQLVDEVVRNYAGELDEYAPYDKLIYGKYFNEFE